MLRPPPKSPSTPWGGSLGPRGYQRLKREGLRGYHGDLLQASCWAMSIPLLSRKGLCLEVAPDIKAWFDDEGSASF